MRKLSSFFELSPEKMRLLKYREHRNRKARSIKTAIDFPCIEKMKVNIFFQKHLLFHKCK